MTIKKPQLAEDAPLSSGLTQKQLALHPVCDKCGWRKGGVDSWDGTRCKCGKSAPSFRQLFAIADKHAAEAERLDILDNGGDCEVAAAYHDTKASEIRTALAQAVEVIPRK